MAGATTRCFAIKLRPTLSSFISTARLRTRLRRGNSLVASWWGVMELNHPSPKAGDLQSPPLPLRNNSPQTVSSPTLAAEAGFEPATLALTGRRTTIVLLGNCITAIKKPLGFLSPKGFLFRSLVRVLEDAIHRSPKANGYKEPVTIR